MDVDSVEGVCHYRADSTHVANLTHRDALLLSSSAHI